VTQELDHRINLSKLLLQTLDAQARRTGLIAQLALLAYRLDHQRYPETLFELSPKYLRQGLRKDPYSDSLLEYRPQGFALPLRVASWHMKNIDNGKVPAHTPILWSVGFGNHQSRETVKAIQLQTTENHPYYYRPLLLFPLPKIKPPESVSADKAAEEPDENDVEKTPAQRSEKG